MLFVHIYKIGDSVSLPTFFPHPNPGNENKIQDFIGHNMPFRLLHSMNIFQHDTIRVGVTTLIQPWPKRELVEFILL